MISKNDIKKEFTVKQDYDFEGDSLFFNITDKYKYQRSVRLNDNIFVDFDEKDVPVALEILNASKLLHVKKSSLTKPVGIEMCIAVGKELIKLEAKFLISVHQKKTPMSLRKEIANNINLKVSEAHFAKATA